MVEVVEVGEVKEVDKLGEVGCSLQAHSLAEGPLLQRVASPQLGLLLGWWGGRGATRTLV